MFADSVVTRTGQFWKLAVSVVLMLVGSFAPLWDGFGISWTLGTILVVVGYAFGIWYIVCPKCRNRWFWSAALDARLYGPLMKSPECPVCKHEFHAS
jgi:hypothetical protein